MKRFLVLFLSVFTLLSNNAFSCTTAVISGKATSDGRPILWKMRDTDFLKNYMKYFKSTDSTYAFTGVINSVDTLALEVWAGTNEKGFAIMNSASFNVNLNDSIKLDNQEGYFMKEALEKCANLKEFEDLLNKKPKPLGLAAHFGVIDANGGAAFYEVNNYNWTKYDANDPKVAPDGYVLRTNFSETGKPNIGYGFVRLETAKELFSEATKNNSINYKTIIQDFSRCLYNSVTKNNYRQLYENKPYSDTFVHSDNLITSTGAASCTVIQGVLPTEDCSMNTLWTMVGFPNTCITLPIFTNEDDVMPEVLEYNKTLKNSPLNNYSLKLKDRCYPIDNPDGYHYLLIGKLVNKEGTGYIQLIEPVEKEIFALTEEKLAKWRSKKPSVKELKAFYNELDKMVEELYKDML
ncbi:MAG: hypothetical protein ACOX4D_00750 [Bacteroidales bacterium]|jgi:hypothetical protein